MASSHQKLLLHSKENSRSCVVCFTAHPATKWMLPSQMRRSNARWQLKSPGCSCHPTPCDALPSPSALRPTECSFAKRVLQTFTVFPHFFIPLKTEISLWLGAVALYVDFLIQKSLFFFNGTEEALNLLFQWFLKVVHVVVCSLLFKHFVFN